MRRSRKFYGEDVMALADESVFQKEVIEQLGGEIKSSLSSKTTFLLAGENAGPSKLTKAENLSIVVLSEDEFRQMII